MAVYESGAEDLCEDALKIDRMGQNIQQGCVHTKFGSFCKTVNFTKAEGW